MDVHGFIPASRVIGAMFFVVALVLLGVAGFFYHSTKVFHENAIVAKGTVVELAERSGESGITFVSVFEFTDLDGERRRVHSSTSSFPAAHAVGEEVEVHYDPANSADARIYSFRSVWIWVILVAGMALVPVCPGVLFFFLIPFTIRRVWPKTTRGDDSEGLVSPGNSPRAE